MACPPLLARAERAPGARFWRSTSRRGGRCCCCFRAAIAVFLTFSFLALSAIGAAPRVQCVRCSVAGPTGTRMNEKGRTRIRFARADPPPPPRYGTELEPLLKAGGRFGVWPGKCGVRPSAQIDGCYTRSCVTLWLSFASLFRFHPPACPVGFGILGIPLPVLLSMVVSRCRGIGPPPSGIPSSGLCFCWPPTTSSCRHPTPARPFPIFFCLCWCGLSRAGFLSFPAPFFFCFPCVFL